MTQTASHDHEPNRQMMEAEYTLARANGVFINLFK